MGGASVPSDCELDIVDVSAIVDTGDKQMINESSVPVTNKKFD